MDLLEAFFTIIAVSIAVPAVFAVLGVCKARQERKFTPDGAIRTRPLKLVSALIIGFGILMLGFGIVGIVCCCIYDKEHTTVLVVVLASLAVAAIVALWMFTYAALCLRCIIADDEGIYVCKPFRKKRFYRYEEIASFKATFDKGVSGVLCGYDKENKKIFSVDNFQVGTTAVADRLREHGVTERV